MSHKKTALITGATSGIGKVFADRFAGMGYDLIITGRRKKIIDAVSADIAARHGVKVSVIIAELSEETGIKKVLNAVKKAGPVDALVNNAGFGLDKLFHQDEIENHISMINVHVTAAVRLTHAVLPGMIKNRDGIIINLSSVGSFLPMPFNSIYGSTKLFLNCFTESLHTELKDKGIKLQSLCPGFTTTDFHQQMGIEDQIKKQVKRWMPAEKVVDGSLKALKKGKIIYIPGLENRLYSILPLLLPRFLYYRIVRRFSKEYLD